MSRHADVTLVWVDGEYLFRLGIGQLRELQEKTDAGPVFVAHRLETGLWLLDDVREPIRLGLIGGGMQREKALSLVVRHVDCRPLIESVPFALKIVKAAIFGSEDEPLGKQEAAEEQTLSQTASSPSPPSTDQGQSSDTPPRKSTE